MHVKNKNDLKYFKVVKFQSYIGSNSKLVPKKFQLTILKDSFNVKAVGGAGLVVGAPLQVVGQLSCSAVVDDARLVLADCIWTLKSRFQNKVLLQQNVPTFRK